METREVRAKALSKIKHNNFSGLSAAAYTFAALTLLAGDLTGIYWLDVAITYVVGFITAQFAAAGYVRVAMGKWRQGKGGFRELAGCFVSIKTMGRCALPCAAYAAILTVFRHVVMPGDMLTALIAGVCLILAHIFTTYALYGVELCPEKGAVAAAVTGVRTAARGIVQILEMKVFMYWWIAGIIALTMYCCLSGKLPGFIMALIVFLIGLVLRWMVGAYIALSEAGLARKLFMQE